MAKHPGGRKWFDGRDERSVVDKLEYVWGLGGSDSEAAFYADIDKATLCRYLQSHPEVNQRKEALKENPILKARESIYKAIKDGQADLALKYLERKRKDEFGERKEIILDDSKRVEWAKATLANPELTEEISKIMGKLAK